MRGPSPPLSDCSSISISRATRSPEEGTTRAPDAGTTSAVIPDVGVAVGNNDAARPMSDSEGSHSVSPEGIGALLESLLRSDHSLEILLI